MELIELKFIADVLTGYPFKSNLYGNEGIRAVRGENITEGKLRWDSIKCWNEPFDKKDFYSLKSDDIVIGMDGSKVGKNKARIFEEDLPLLLAQRVACLRTNEKADQVYLYYCINNPRFEEYVFRIQTGSSVPHISKTQIENFQIPIPSLIIQKQIAKVLSDLDAKIEVNNKINQELEALAKSIYDYWFVQFDFPDQNGKPYKSSGGKMLYNEELKREIPEGWEVKPLYEVIKIFDSKRIPLSKSVRETMIGDVPYYGATSIMGYVNDFIFNDDYILLAEDGSIMDDKGFPIVQFIWGKTWVNNHAHVIQAENKEYNEFVFQLLKMIPVVLIKTGSIQMKINQENLKNHKVLIPSQNLIEKYSKKASVIRKQLINNTEQNQKLAALRDWLLPMLMNGQVTVKSSDEVREQDKEILNLVQDDNKQVQDNSLGRVAEDKEAYKINR